MNLEDYRTLFVTGSLALTLVMAVPALSLIVPVVRETERFSELWLLGPGHMVGDYPFNVSIGEEYRIFVGVTNHMGCSEYYRIHVKFCNQTRPLSDTSGSEPSPLPPLYEFQCFVADGETYESIVTIAFQNVSLQGDSVSVRSISINGVVFPIDCLSKRDSENGGFYYQLFFELSYYNVLSQEFQYHNRSVRIWLNITGS